jgi:transcriptional regulator with XRE-family HTH domain
VRTVGDNLKTLRGKMNQDELASRAGLKQGDISKWETNKTQPTVKNVLKLAKGLRRPIEDLVAGVDSDYDAMRSDLISHAGDQASGFSQGAGPDVTAPAASSRLQQQHDALLKATEQVAIQLADALAAQGVELQLHRDDARTRKGKPGARPRARKAG